MSRSKFSDVSELPRDKVLIEYIREAVALNEQGVKIARPKRQKKPEAKVPADLQAAPRRTRRRSRHSRRSARAIAASTWSGSPRPNRKRRGRSCVAQAIEWLADGKSRHWKYQRK